MTQKEYHQLLRNSAAFAGLGKDLRERILKAKGEQREQYAQVFLAEQNGVAAAQAHMMESNAEIVKSFETATKKVKKDFYQKTEIHQKKKETEAAETLLESIKK